MTRSSEVAGSSNSSNGEMRPLDWSQRQWQVVAAAAAVAAVEAEAVVVTTAGSGGGRGRRW